MGNGLYHALLFDLDGTLAETIPSHMPTWAAALKPYGFEVDDEFYREKISGRSAPDVLASLLPDLSEDEIRSLAETKEAGFRERAGDVKPLPGLIDFVAVARENGLRVALVTNAPKENVIAVLRALDLERDFDEVVVADEVGAVKPDPAPYKAALDRMDLAPGEAVAFEDSVSGIASAVGAGIPTVGIGSSDSPARLRDAGVFMVVRDFTDKQLLKLLNS